MAYEPIVDALIIAAEEIEKGEGELYRSQHARRLRGASKRITELLSEVETLTRERDEARGMLEVPPECPHLWIPIAKAEGAPRKCIHCGASPDADTRAALRAEEK